MTLSFPRFMLFLGNLQKTDKFAINASSLQTVVKAEEDKKKLESLMEQVQQNKDRRQTSKEAEAKQRAEAEAAREALKAAQELTFKNSEVLQEKSEEKAFMEWYEQQKVVLAERREKLLSMRTRPIDKLQKIVK